MMIERMAKTGRAIALAASVISSSTAPDVEAVEFIFAKDVWLKTAV